MVQSFGAQYAMQQGGGASYEPLRRCTWEVQIPGIDLSLAAQSCSLPSLEFEEAKLYHFNGHVKYATNPTFSDISIDILDTVQPDIVQQLWTWTKQVGDPNTWQMSYASKYKKSCLILLYDIEGALIRTWTARGCWPKRGPTPEEPLDYSAQQEAMKIRLALACDFATLDQSASG